MGMKRVKLLMGRGRYSAGEIFMVDEKFLSLIKPKKDYYPNAELAPIVQLNRNGTFVVGMYAWRLEVVKNEIFTDAEYEELWV